MIKEAEEERLRLEFEKEGKGVLPKLESEVSDSNVITPGTEFMYKLSKALRKYLCTRMELNSGWKHLKVFNYHLYIRHWSWILLYLPV